MPRDNSALPGHPLIQCEARGTTSKFSRYGVIIVKIHNTFLFVVGIVQISLHTVPDQPQVRYQRTVRLGYRVFSRGTIIDKITNYTNL